MEHKDEADAITYKTTGWYALGVYRLPIKGAQIKPYVMFEGLDAPAGESFRPVCAGM